jgi:non-ribosomal peptide synthase protein (TIGR01720 family)
VLGVKKIGTQDSFFELGGDSIKAIQVATKVQNLGWNLKVQHIFQAPTVHQLVPLIEEQQRQAEQGQVIGTVPFTPIQHRFFEHHEENVHHYNQSILLKSFQRLDADKMQQVLEKIVDHHDVLRMRFHKSGDDWVQINEGVDVTNFQLDVFDLQKEDADQAMIQSLGEKLHNSLDIGEGPLMRVGLLQTRESDYLLFVAHHLVIDGVSWRILLEDLSKGYEQLLYHQSIELPVKTDSYLDWANGLVRYANSSKLKQEVDYWTKLEQYPLAKLPKDHSISKSYHADNEEIMVQLLEIETQQLLGQIHHAYHTEINDILLTALGMTLKEWIGMKRVGIQLEGHGREEISDQLHINRTIGWFTSVFPVVFDFSAIEPSLSQEQNFSYGVKHVKETLRRIPKKGIGYGLLKYMSHLPNHSFSLTPEITFNYLGQFDEVLADSTLFQIATHHTGNTVSPNAVRSSAIDIIAVVLDGKLHVKMQYNKKEYDRTTISEVIEQLKRNLLGLIQHCIGKTEPEKTPSDFGNKHLSLEELQYVQQLFED